MSKSDFCIPYFRNNREFFKIKHFLNLEKQCYWTVIVFLGHRCTSSNGGSLKIQLKYFIKLFENYQYLPDLQRISLFLLSSMNSNISNSILPLNPDIFPFLHSPPLSVFSSSGNLRFPSLQNTCLSVPLGYLFIPPFRILVYPSL